MQHPNPLWNKKLFHGRCWWCGTVLGQVVKAVATPDGRVEKVHGYCARLFKNEMETTK